MSGLGQKAPAFIFIFPLELLVVSRIVVAFAKLTKWSWIYRVFAEIGLPPRVLLCWRTMVCFAVQSWLGLAWPVTIVYAVSVLLVQTFQWDCVWLASFIFGGTTHLV